MYRLQIILISASLISLHGAVLQAQPPVAPGVNSPDESELNEQESTHGDSTDSLAGTPESPQSQEAAEESSTDSKDLTDETEASEEEQPEENNSETEKTKEESDEEESDEEESDGEESDGEESDEEESDEEESDEEESDEEEKTKKSAEKKEAKEGETNSSDGAHQKQQKSEPASKPYLVEQKHLKIEIEMAGSFVAKERVEIALRPKVWSQFKVLEAVPHGTRVHKGDVLVRFDDKKIEESIAGKSLDQRLEDLTLMALEEEFPRYEEMSEIQWKMIQRNHEDLVANYDRFQQHGRPLSEKIANFNFRSAQESLAMEQEELDQLRKMYEADDLTEETEKIVLHRQEFAVEMAKLYIAFAQFNRDTALNVTLPQQDKGYSTSLKRSKLALERAKMSKSLGLSKMRYELEKKKLERKQHVEQHAKLMGDRDLMVIKSPTEGMAYYGSCVDGKWPGVSTLRSKLKPFGSVPARTVLFTIVQPDSMEIWTSISEKNFPQMRVGLTATIVPTGDDELEWGGKVSQVDSVPSSRGKFPLRIEFNPTEAPDWLVPDMTCKVKVVTYENSEAILIPQEYLDIDKDRKNRAQVLLFDEDEEKSVQRKVRLGRRKGKLIEVVKGLEDGEKILAHPASAD